MTSKDIKIEQAHKLHETVRRQLRYLGKLVKRLEHLRVPHTDPLYHHAYNAYCAVHGLTSISHGLTVRMGCSAEGPADPTGGEKGRGG